MTHRTDFVFTVIEHESEQPWIMLEPLCAPDLALPTNSFLGLDLPPGATLVDAQEFACTLNDRIRFVTITL